MIPDFRIRHNQAFLLEGTRILYKGRARDPERSYLFLDDAGIQVRLTGEELALARAENRLRDWVPERDDADRSGPTRTCWETATGAERLEALRKVDYCMEWARDPGAPRTARGLQPVIDRAYRRRKQEAEAARRFEPPPPCVSSVQKWVRSWLGEDRKAEPLVPQTRCRGNRRPRLAENVRSLVLDLIDEHYLAPSRKSVAEVHKEIEKAFKVRNRGLSQDQRWPAPSYGAVLKAVHGLCEFTVMFCREGPRKARVKFRHIGSGIVTERANEVWEIDDTRLDLICVGEDGETPIGRPWLVVVIDRYSRMIMGFVITFNPPDTTSAMEALKVAILSKTELLRDLGVQGEWPAEGRPDVVHVDNAKHYNSTALTTSLSRLGIAHRTMPVLKAWYRGVVERVIGTLLRQVFHRMLGTTFSGIYERDEETPPEKVAVATIDEARRKLAEWIVVTYQHRLHKGLDGTPFAAFVRSATQQRLPLAREDVEQALSLTVARALRADAIQFKQLKYRSPELLRLRMLPRDQAVNELVVRVDREDLEVIRWLDPASGEWLPAFLDADMVQRVRGRTLEEYEIARALRRNRPEEFGDSDPTWTATYVEAERLRNRKAASGKLSNRVQAEAERERTMAHARRAAAPRAEAGPEAGEDLSAQVDRIAGHAPPGAGEAGTEPTRPGPRQPAEETPAGTVSDFAALHGLGARVRKHGKEG